MVVAAQSAGTLELIPQLQQGTLERYFALLCTIWLRTLPIMQVIDNDNGIGRPLIQTMSFGPRLLGQVGGKEPKKRKKRRRKH